MRKRMLAVCLVAMTPLPALAWGFTGHTIISRAGATSFPTFLPAFVRGDAAIAEIAALGPELDRSKGAGATHDRDLDPGHYADVGDDGTIFGVPLATLPPTREAYDTALRAADSDQYRAGYLPYSLIDGWQQIAKDFAIWRVDAVGERTAAEADDRARFAADRALREVLTIRDIGIWSHYVGDASQPLHVTIHFNGWGRSPNPHGFSESTALHADFESRFVRAHATLAAVRSLMAPLAVSSAPIATLVGRYLAATAAQVVPLYEIDERGGFKDGTPEAVAFADARLADGAAELRDLVADAWYASATVGVGYPHAVTPAEVESKRLVPTWAGLSAAD